MKGVNKGSIFAIPLVRELAVVLVIKLVVLFAIKDLFFSQPVTQEAQAQGVQEMFGLPEPRRDENEKKEHL
ncbi:MAG: hypothetical protein R3E62_12585 [Pseudomonadales bacterium]|jgi:hypothetical protein